VSSHAVPGWYVISKYRVFLEQFIVVHLIKKVAVMEPKGSSPFSRKPVFGPCLESVQSITLTPFIFPSIDNFE
jgi:hypothetical protein